MTIIHVGNADAVQRIKREGNLVFEPVPGEQTTTFRVDSTYGVYQTIAIIKAGLSHMMSPIGRPWWIETDDEDLAEALRVEFGLSQAAMQRPFNWGDGSTTATGRESQQEDGEET